MTWNLAEVILHWNLLLHADEEGGEPRWRPCLERPYNHPSWSPYVEGSYHTRGQVGWYYRTPWLLLWMLPHPAPPGSHQEPIETKSPLVAFQVLKSACIAQCNEWEVAEVLIRISWLKHKSVLSTRLSPTLFYNYQQNLRFTLTHKSQGHNNSLNFLKDLGKRLNCENFHLDQFGFSAISKGWILLLVPWK